jgi:DNA-directed RNA polymerase I, II, and III subunit RPABC2
MSVSSVSGVSDAPVQSKSKSTKQTKQTKPAKQAKQANPINDTSDPLVLLDTETANKKKQPIGTIDLPDEPDDAEEIVLDSNALDDDDDEGDEDDDNEDLHASPESDADTDDECSYNLSHKSKNANLITATILREDEHEDEAQDREIIYAKPEHRCSPPYLTNFERVRLLGERTSQLAQNAKPMIHGVDGCDPRLIAQLELESHMIPIKIDRTMPDGTHELWTLGELKLKKKHIKYGFAGGMVDKNKYNQIEEEYQKGGNVNGFDQLMERFKM